MKNSITQRITLYLVVLSLVIVGLIAFIIRFFLPDYYTNYQLNILENKTIEVQKAYEKDLDEALFVMNEIQQLVGGEIYVQSSSGQVSGFGMQGKGQGSGQGNRGNEASNNVMNNSERFVPDGEVTTYTYENKVGLDVYTIGIEDNGEYIVYEVSVQSLDDAIDVILKFVWWILAGVLILAVIASVLLSASISKPIKDLNKLAKDMKSKKVQSVMVATGHDEISELNTSLNELYEELLSSIYQLESELAKERNAEQLKKRFLAQATHELKTPIAVIRGYAEVLYDGMYKDGEDRDRYLKNIYDESESISHLILDVLDYTKMETGNYTLMTKELNALSFFESIATRYRDYVQEQDLSFISSIDLDEGLSINIDGKRVEQVVKNLLSNAVEHGLKKVEFRVSKLGQHINIQVMNDGEPIDEEDLPYVFDSFYKSAKKQSGTGLGLAIVKEIVLLHHGEYRVDNLVNGVAFSIML